MTLDIIVPHYDEPWGIGKPLFEMLALQRGVSFSDFRVILVNDGQEDDVYPEVIRQKYPYEVIGIQMPHGGVSAARNRGIEFSAAKWVMFCDFDDTFSSVFSLRAIFDALVTEDYDLLWTPFYMEVNEDHNRREKRGFNLIFTHGKIYRRDFLHEHGIRFEESLYFSEDAAFNRVIEMEIDPLRIGEIKSEIVPYVWTFRKGSITTDPKRVYSNSIGLFRRQKYVAEEHLKRGQKTKHDALVIRGMCDAWVALNRKDLKCDRSSLDAEAWEYYKTKKDAIEINLATITSAETGALQEMGVTKDVMPEGVTFAAWLDEFTRRHSAEYREAI